MTPKDQTSAEPVPTTAEIVARAVSLLPVLRERAAACEQLRRIPDETIADIKQSGLLRIAQPRRFGGYGLGLEVAGEAAMEIGRACGATAWMVGQWPGHQYMVGWFSLEAQEEYYDGNPNRMSSTASSVARLNIEPERGGWRIRDTQLRFSSGCDAAEWIIMFSRHGCALIPKSDFSVLDDWFVAGLRGTGSKSIVIADAWVPPHRFVPMEQIKNGNTPGAALYPDMPYYQGPNMVSSLLLLTPTIGMARGVLDAFEERVTKRTDLHTGKPASEGAGAQLRFAESHAEVDAAMMFARRNFDYVLSFGRAKRQANTTERAIYRRDICYAARLCVQATQRLISQGDASGMFDNNRIGRLARDVGMASLQASLGWDEHARSFSLTRWGMPPSSVLV